MFAAALKEIVKHRKDLASLADLADRQRRSVGTQTLVERPQRGIRHVERAAAGLAAIEVGEKLAHRQYFLGKQLAHRSAVRMGVVSVGSLGGVDVPVRGAKP